MLCSSSPHGRIKTSWLACRAAERACLIPSGITSDSLCCLQSLIRSHSVSTRNLHRKEFLVDCFKIFSMLIVQNIFVLDVIKFGDKKVNYLVQKNGKNTVQECSVPENWREKWSRSSIFYKICKNVISGKTSISFQLTLFLHDITPVELLEPGVI